MRMDFLRWVDVLVVVCVALAWSQPVWAQSDEEFCERESRIGITVDNPAKVMQTIAWKKKRCLAQRERDTQMESIAHHTSSVALCNQTAKASVKQDSKENYAKVYGTCMRGHRYVP